MRFKQFLREQEGQFLTNPDQIRNWLSGFAGIFNNYEIDGNGTVNIRGHINLNSLGMTHIPVKFGEIFGSFNIHNNKLTSLVGSPDDVGDFLCFSNKLTSLEGASSIIDGRLLCYDNPIKSLVGIHKIIKKMNGAILIDTFKIERGGIGLLLIPGLQGINPEGTLSRSVPFSIINKYVGKPDQVYDCQAELIDAGWEEYAIL